MCTTYGVELKIFLESNFKTPCQYSYMTSNDIKLPAEMFYARQLHLKTLFIMYFFTFGRTGDINNK